MAAVFKKTLPDDDPLDAMEREAAAAEALRVRKAQQLVDDLTKQRDALSGKSALPAEQVMSNQYENDKAYKLGMVAMLNPNQGVQQLGGTMFKNALAQRTPQVTEHGIANPLTGEWSYSPEYQRQKLDAQITAARQHAADTEDKGIDRTAARREGYAFKKWMAANKPQQPDRTLVIVQNPDGSLSYKPRGEAAGMAAPPTTASTGGNASEGERKAATLLSRLDFSRTQLDQAVKDEPAAEVSTVTNKGLQQVPYVGEDLANIKQSPARQRVEAAQLDILDAALTLGTGAAYTREQLKGYARSYFAQPGDDPTTRADKKARLANVIKAAEIAAGRAGPNAPHRAPGQQAPAAAAPGTDPNDPLGASRMFPDFRPQ